MKNIKEIKEILKNKKTLFFYKFEDSIFKNNYFEFFTLYYNVNDNEPIIIPFDKKEIDIDKTIVIPALGGNIYTKYGIVYEGRII